MNVRELEKKSYGRIHHVD